MPTVTRPITFISLYGVKRLTATLSNVDHPRSRINFDAYDDAGHRIGNIEVIFDSAIDAASSFTNLGEETPEDILHD